MTRVLLTGFEPFGGETVNPSWVAVQAVARAWSGPELVGRAQYRFGSRWFALGGLDAGLVTWPVAGLDAAQRRLIHGNGAWVSLELGVGASF